MFPDVDVGLACAADLVAIDQEVLEPHVTHCARGIVPGNDRDVLVRTGIADVPE